MKNDQVPEIRVRIKREPLRSILHLLVRVALFCLPIYLGHLLGSVAMQWLGFVFVLAGAFLASVGSVQFDKQVLTVKEARERLDMIERGEL